MIFVQKRQNRPSEKPFTGVPPPFTISQNSKPIERTLFWWAKIQMWYLSKNVKIDPQEYALQVSSLPLLFPKTPKPQNELYFDGRKLKRDLWPKTSKKALNNTFYRGPPPFTISINSKNIERTLFWWAKIKTWTLTKNVKIDLQKYVLQGFPLPLLSPKTLKA